MRITGPVGTVLWRMADPDNLYQVDGLIELQLTGVAGDKAICRFSRAELMGVVTLCPLETFHSGLPCSKTFTISAHAFRLFCPFTLFTLFSSFSWYFKIIFFAKCNVDKNDGSWKEQF